MTVTRPPEGGLLVTWGNHGRPPMPYRRKSGWLYVAPRRMAATPLAINKPWHVVRWPTARRVFGRLVYTWSYPRGVTR
jgi:hypothetical protein